MRSLIFARTNPLKTLSGSEHLKTTKLKALYAKISPKLGYARTVTNASLRTGLRSWDATLSWMFRTRQSIATHFWIKSVVFMDLDATLSIKTSPRLMSRRNGTKFTATIERLFGNAVRVTKVEYWQFWAFECMIFILNKIYFFVY